MDEHNLKNELESALLKISSLEKRVAALEKSRIPGPAAGAAPSAEHPAAAPWAAPGMNSDIQSEGSQLGWLGLIISLLSFGFFIRHSFTQNWVAGWGQAAVLGGIGAVLIVAGYIFREKGHTRFGTTLGACGAAALFLFCYWPSGYLSLLSPLPSLIGSAVIGAALIGWGFRRDSQLWPVVGLVGSLVLPLSLYGGGFGNPEPAIIFFTMAALFIAASFMKDWRWLAPIGSLLGHLAVIITLRGFRENAASSPVPLEWAVTLFAALLIVWSAAAHIGARRAPRRAELVTWGINTALLYVYLIAFWGMFADPYTVLAPAGAGIIIMTAAQVRLPGSPYNIAYETGLAVSIAAAFTILPPPPFDIASLCLFSVLLAYLGNRRQQWDLKGLSGALVAWSIIFLVVARLRFSAEGDIPFINFRFASFVVAFLCFGFQGRMINYDATAGKFGPLLGQGLFSLGLLVLMVGMGGETVHLLPSTDGQSISESALLALTVLGGILSLTTASLGLLLDLKYLRLVALTFFIALLAKLAFMDLPRMGTLNLVLSLSSVGALLAAASILYKIVGSKPKKEPAG